VAQRLRCLLVEYVGHGVTLTISIRSGGPEIKAGIDVLINRRLTQLWRGHYGGPGLEG
jgi:hypothetical protein